VKNLLKKLKDNIIESRQKQKDRWMSRKADRLKYGEKIQAVKSTKKGAQRGAFGHCKNVPSCAHPFTPAQMRERYGKKTTGK
jgi:hypothetical protein